MGLFLAVMNGKIIEVSEALIMETGYNEKDFLNKTIDEAFETLKCSIDSGNIYEKKYYYIFNKSLDFKKVKIHKIKHPKEKFDFIVFIKMNDENIRNSIEFLKGLYKNSVVAAAVYSVPELDLISANTRYIKNNSRFKREDSYGKNIYEVTTDFSGTEREKAMLDVVNARKTIHLSQYKSLDSENYASYWDITGVPVFFNGEIEYIVETSIDVTEKVMDKFLIKEQNNLIIQGNELIEAVFQNVPISIAIIDSKGNLLKENKFSKKIIEKGPLSGGTEKIFEKGCCFDDNGKRMAYEDIPSIRVSRGEKFYRELIVLKSGNDNIYLRTSGEPIYNSEGQFQMGIVCVWDVTNTVKYSEMLLREKDLLISSQICRNTELRETLKEQEEFFSNISHEFKTPLNVILSSLQLMGLHTDEKAASKYTEIMKLNSYRLLRMINNLIDISEINSGNYALSITRNDIVELVEDISLSVIGYAEKKGVNIVFDTNIEENVIGCDPFIIERILLNLLSNALKFTSMGDMISVTLTEMGEEFSISVKDTGIGIMEENMDTIFERFSQVDKSFTRTNEGSGLGLAIVKALVNFYGGTISTVSQLGKGSEFNVTLPVKYNYSAECRGRNFDEKSRAEQINIEFSDIYLS
jgi:signal transduction histidine kinase